MRVPGLPGSRGLTDTLALVQHHEEVYPHKLVGLECPSRLPTRLNQVLPFNNRVREGR